MTTYRPHFDQRQPGIVTAYEPMNYPHPLCEKLDALGLPWFATDDGACLLINGDCLEILPLLAESSIDAVITDPPYSSGGAFRGDRAQKAITKYVQSESQDKYSDFTGDSRDQRSFLAWCSLWLLASRRACTPGSVLCSFIDWRQLPVFTDAVQCGGWVWRNIGTWWKPGVRMQRGRFSSSAEYVVYATNGPHESDGECSPQNVFQCQTLGTEEKDHIAEKPHEVALWITGLVRPSGVILDPFMGSGAFGVSAMQTRRKFIGFDCDLRSYELACDRITKEIKRTELLEKPPQIVQRSFLEER